MKITVQNQQPNQARRRDKTFPSSESGQKKYLNEHISVMIEVSVCYVMSKIIDNTAQENYRLSVAPVISSEPSCD